MIKVLAFLQQYVCYYASAVLGGFAALWMQSQGLFSLITLGYVAGVVFMPVVVKALQGGSSFAEKWSRINEVIDQFQGDALNPTIDLAQLKGTELAEWIDQIVERKLKETEKPAPRKRSAGK